MLLAVLALAGCGSNRVNSLQPHSHAARQIDSLWWWMLGGSAVGFGVIAVLLLLGWTRRHREQLPFGGGDRAATALVVGLGIAVPLVVLTLLFVWADVFVVKSTAAPKPGSTRLEVDVVGEQWWWDVRYPASGVVTANEIHIPVGVPVRLVVTTRDVIHSFWVPELNRKIDTIPGRRNAIELLADRPGRYLGQCAEFCGLQHAHMQFLVYADPPAVFRAWLAGQARKAAKPTANLARAGERVFLREPCAACHTIAGTSADARVGPDLTHLASRSSLAANTIPNTHDSLADWIGDPNHAKPGAKMPRLDLKPADLRALVAYLETLR